MTTVSAPPKFLPYGRQHLEETDIEAVVEVLRSDWWTQGPAVEAFETKLAEYVGARYAVASSSGTAALHLTMAAMGIGPGDVVATVANSFLATANCARYVGADVKFADVDPETGMLDLKAFSRLLAADTERKIKAVIPVHFAGQPVDLPGLSALTAAHDIRIVSDACHALGASYECDGLSVRVGNGRHEQAAVFSFHPVKHVAMGEGGAVTTNDAELAERLRLLRNHGMRKIGFIELDMATAPSGGDNPWYYEMHEPGFNYRLTDIQAALGRAQLGRIDWSLGERNELAARYRHLIRERFDPSRLRPLRQSMGIYHAYHLFVILVDFDHFGVDRATVMKELRQAGIGTQVHYIPIHLQPYYRKLYGGKPGDLPHTDEYYAQALSLPMYPNLTAADCERIIENLDRILNRGRH